MIYVLHMDLRTDDGHVKFETRKNFLRKEAALTYRDAYHDAACVLKQVFPDLFYASHIVEHLTCDNQLFVAPNY